MSKKAYLVGRLLEFVCLTVTNEGKPPVVSSQNALKSRLVCLVTTFYTYLQLTPT
jgi:hypothetical protein